MRLLIRLLIVTLTIAALSGCRAKYVNVPTPVAVPIPADSALVTLIVDCPGKDLAPVVRMLQHVPGKKLESEVKQNGNALSVKTRYRADTITQYVPISRQPIEVPGPIRYVTKPPGLISRIRMTVGDITLVALALWGAPKIIRRFNLLKNFNI